MKYMNSLIVRFRKMITNNYSRMVLSTEKAEKKVETTKEDATDNHLFSKKGSQNKIININDPRAIGLASSYLKRGEVIALPTDTVYGLACNANDPEAIQKLYAIKGRETAKPVAICVADLNSLRTWGKAMHLQEELLCSLLPGPVTIVLIKSSNLDNPYLNPGVSKIGIRIPNYKFIQDVCDNFQLPVALTSANRSSEKSTLNINEFKKLWPHLKAIFDGGKLGLTEEQRSASTVIDMSTPSKYVILREGIAISKTLDIMKQFNIFLNS